MTRAQLHALAARVIDLMGNLAEDVDDDERATLARWAARLPGTAWDTRLGDADGNRPLT